MEPPRFLPESFAEQLATVQARIDANNQRILEVHARLVQGHVRVKASAQCLAASYARLEATQPPGVKVTPSAVAPAD